MYFVLPETEGKTLEDIEIYFSDTQRKYTDIIIHSADNNLPHSMKTIKVEANTNKT